MGRIFQKCSPKKGTINWKTMGYGSYRECVKGKAEPIKSRTIKYTTVNLTPRWPQVMEDYIEILEGKNPFIKGNKSTSEQRALVKRDLRKLAKAADANRRR